MEWTYNGKVIREISDLPNSEILHGFIYLVTNMMTGKKYIGQKFFYHSTTKKLSKKAIAALSDKRASKKKTVTKESDWKSYYGSAKNAEWGIQLENTPKSVIKREILELCCNKSYLTYAEVKWIFKLNALESDEYANGNILGKFYNKSTKNCF